MIDANEQTQTELPSSNDKKSKKANAFLFFGWVVVLFIILIPSLLDLFKSDEKPGKENLNNKENIISVISKTNFAKEETPPKVELKQIEKREFDVTEKEEPIRPIIVQTKSINIIEEEEINRSGADIMITSGSDTTQQVEYDLPSSSNSVDAERVQTNLTPDTEQEASVFNAPVFKATRARKSEFNPHLLLEQGTLIQCSLRGRLVTNISGQISCIVANDVWSKSGAVILIDKGSRVNGFYKGASAKHGHSQIFAVWQEVRTPNNIIVPLNSGSTTELGENGLSGYADNHFWSRFKNAILLSLINDTTGALTSRLGRNNDNLSFDSTSESANEIATIALEQSGDITPTIYKNQGDTIGVFVARDIDFSEVYSLEE